MQFITIIAMPLTYSIAYGIIFGIASCMFLWLADTAWDVSKRLRTHADTRAHLRVGSACGACVLCRACMQRLALVRVGCFVQAMRPVMYVCDARYVACYAAVQAATVALGVAKDRTWRHVWLEFASSFYVSFVRTGSAVACAHLRVCWPAP